MDKTNSELYRTQQTQVGNSLSYLLYLSRDAVQGSVIRPLLYVLFINDIVCIFSGDRCVCKMFAGDVKIYPTLDTVNVWKTEESWKMMQ